MNIKELFTDDGAVSPVIGVILMVAITVILAAVIASFVLGLGQQAGDNSPSASFDIEYNEGDDLDGHLSVPGNVDGSISITHDTGETIEAQELFIKGSSIKQNGDNTEWHNQYDSQGNEVGSGPSSDVSSGDTVYVGANGDFELRVVWQPPEKDTSSTLSEETGPDA